MPNSKSPIKIKTEYGICRNFIEYILSKMNWATVSDLFRDTLMIHKINYEQKMKYFDLGLGLKSLIVILAIILYLVPVKMPAIASLLSATRHNARFFSRYSIPNLG